jgi:hypothetical protein
MWGNMGFQPQPVTVSRRIAPPLAAAKLHVIVSDHADSQLMALVIGIVHRIMTVPVKQYTVRELGIRAASILLLEVRVCEPNVPTPAKIKAPDPLRETTAT